MAGLMGYAETEEERAALEMHEHAQWEAATAGAEFRTMMDRLNEIEAELREQASGSQDGYLLDVANRMRDALKDFSPTEA